MGARPIRTPIRTPPERTAYPSCKDLGRRSVGIALRRRREPRPRVGRGSSDLTRLSAGDPRSALPAQDSLVRKRSGWVPHGLVGFEEILEMAEVRFELPPRDSGE